MAGAVYWIGQDGNIYTKGLAGEQGVQNEGKALYPGDLTGSFAAAKGSGKATEIADPNPGNKAATTAAPADPNNTAGSSSSGSSGTAYEDKSNDIAVQNAGLGTVDTSTQSAIDKINAALASVTGEYDTEDTNEKGQYTTNSNNNENALQTDKQTAYVNAASGRLGLLGTLAGLGALSGSGITLANNAVQKGANEDLSTAGNTFSTNKTSLDQADLNYTTQDAARRKDAQTAAGNDIENAQNTGATAKQSFLSNLAGDYAAEGDKANAAKYSGMAAALYPVIGSTNVPTVSITPENDTYANPQLASSGPGAGQVSTTSGSNTGGGSNPALIPGLVASTTKKQQLVAA